MTLARTTGSRVSQWVNLGIKMLRCQEHVTMKTRENGEGLPYASPPPYELDAKFQMMIAWVGELSDMKVVESLGVCNGVEVVHVPWEGSAEAWVWHWQGWKILAKQKLIQHCRRCHICTVKVARLGLKDSAVCRIFCSLLPLKRTIQGHMVMEKMGRITLK